MPQYALMVWGPVGSDEHDGYATAEENAAQREATGAFNARLQSTGRFVYANGMADASASAVVDGRGETPLVTDGPYLETREHIAGFWIITAADRDEALQLATEGSRACMRPVEVRPMHGG